MFCHLVCWDWQKGQTNFTERIRFELQSWKCRIAPGVHNMHGAYCLSSQLELLALHCRLNSVESQVIAISMTECRLACITICRRWWLLVACISVENHRRESVSRLGIENQHGESTWRTSENLGERAFKSNIRETHRVSRQESDSFRSIPNLPEGWRWKRAQKQIQKQIQKRNQKQILISPLKLSNGTT